MQSNQNPRKFPIPFSDNGDKNVIPIDSQIGVTDGAASLTDGFPPLTFVDIAAGGVGPAGEDFNGVLNQLSDNARWSNAGAPVMFDQDFSTIIGGYPLGSIITSADGLGLWVSITDNNDTDPDTDTSGSWFPMGSSDYLDKSVTTGIYTLDPTEFLKETIVLSGTLVGNVQVIFPDMSGKRWVIVNTTTGPYSVTCRASTDGFLIAQSVASMAYYINYGTLSRLNFDDRYILSGADSTSDSFFVATTSITLTKAMSGKNVGANGSSGISFLLPAAPSAGCNYRIFHNNFVNTVSGGSFRLANGTIGTSYSLASNPGAQTFLFWNSTYWSVFTIGMGEEMPGTEKFWPSSVVPSGWLEEDGSSLVVATYPALFAVIGYSYGGSGLNFNLPDPRGRAITVWDHGKGLDPDASTRTDRGDGTGGDVVGSNQANQNQAHTHTSGINVNSSGGSLLGAGDSDNVSDPINTGSQGGTKARMDNQSRMMIIKY